jgi:hypothetical protein
MSPVSEASPLVDLSFHGLSASSFTSLAFSISIPSNSAAVAPPALSALSQSPTEVSESIFLPEVLQ